jgi:hypothetical protein
MNPQDPHAFNEEFPLMAEDLLDMLIRAFPAGDLKTHVLAGDDRAAAAYAGQLQLIDELIEWRRQSAENFLGAAE